MSRGKGIRFWQIVAVPAALDLLSNAFKVISETIKALKPLGDWLWKNFLKPVGAWTGDITISALSTIVDALKSFSDWINENQSAVEGIVTIIGTFFAVWAAAKLVTAIGTIVTAL